MLTSVHELEAARDSAPHELDVEPEVDQRVRTLEGALGEQQERYEGACGEAVLQRGEHHHGDRSKVGGGAGAVAVRGFGPPEAHLAHAHAVSAHSRKRCVWRR